MASTFLKRGTTFGCYSAKESKERSMADNVVDALVVDSLILDLLEWLATRERSYQEVMEAWRTSCPKLPVWEEANERGLIERD
jgi:hypothetical protein